MSWCMITLLKKTPRAIYFGGFWNKYATNRSRSRDDSGIEEINQTEAVPGYTLLPHKYVVRPGHLI